MNLFTIKKICKEKKSHGDDEAMDFHNKKIPKVGFAYTCLAVSSVNSAHKKMKTIICKRFKRM